MAHAPPSATLETLDDAACRRLLARTTVGRLAVNVGRQPEIFPVNYRLDKDGDVVVRTAEGTKLAGAIMGGQVAFEIDHFDEHQRLGWSVVVHGAAHEPRDVLEVMHDEELGLAPWAEGTKDRFVHITPTKITGRRLVRDDPTEESS